MEGLGSFVLGFFEVVGSFLKWQFVVFLVCYAAVEHLFCLLLLAQRAIQRQLLSVTFNSFVAWFFPYFCWQSPSLRGNCRFPTISFQSLHSLQEDTVL